VGSTHKGEEQIIIDAHKKILETIPNCLLILVPRHKERFNEIFRLLVENKLSTERRSISKNAVANESSVYLGDTMGELLGLYSVADIAFVGGSLIENGGHNILEPAALAKAIISGPSMFNFTEIMGSFKKENAINISNNSHEIASIVCKLLNDKKLLQQYSDNAYKAFMKNNDVVDKQFTPINKILHKNQ
jgi:3-deoxy-D-manno-octulosonic-acid transferase